MEINFVPSINFGRNKNKIFYSTCPLDPVIIKLISIFGKY